MGELAAPPADVDGLTPYPGPTRRALRDRYVGIAKSRCALAGLPILPVLGMHLTQVAPIDCDLLQSKLEGLAMSGRSLGRRSRPPHDSRSSNTGTRWHEPPTPCHIRNVDTETPPATAIERGTRDNLLPSRTEPRTVAEFAGSLPSGDHATGRDYLSQVHTQFARYRVTAHKLTRPGYG